MKKKLISNLGIRLVTEIATQNPVKFMKEAKASDIIDWSIETVYLYTRVSKKNKRKTIYLVEVIAAIGHNIRNKMGLKRDTSVAVKAGAFVLYSFELLGMVRVTLGQGANMHAQYIVQVLNDDAIVKLWMDLDPELIEKLPSTSQYDDWETARHSSGKSMIKTEYENVLNSLSPDKQPVLFNCVNKAQSIGWRINNQILPIAAWALRNKAQAFDDIWSIHSNEAKQSKLRETKVILEIARKFSTKNFYHQYYFDFRGRKYPVTSYLHEQGNDLAKGVLLLKEKKELGEQGFFWLCISIANNWGGSSGREDGLKTDKIPLKERANWTIDNEEILLSYVENPKVNTGWMVADKPWQFLAACYELANLRIWQYTKNLEIRAGIENKYGYKTSIVVYIDGSNNGSQHLAALTRDEITAPHVNLVPSELPGDLYKYVADHVWEKIEVAYKDIPPDDRRMCEAFLKDFTELKQQIADEQGTDEKKELLLALAHLRVQNSELGEKTAIVFWNKVTDAKHRRKVVKR